MCRSHVSMWPRSSPGSLVRCTCRRPPMRRPSLQEEAEVGFEVIADHASAEGAREVWQEAVAAPGWQGGAGVAAW